MSIHIYCKGLEILHVKNSILEALHDRITQHIEDRDIKITNALQLVLNKTNQDIYGIGMGCVDLASYLKNKSDAMFFADLVKIAIESLENEKIIIPEAFVNLRKFHAELLSYAQELP
jgi:hypothetical protein